MEHLDNNFHCLDFKQLHAVANYHEKIAAMMRYKAEQIKEKRLNSAIGDVRLKFFNENLPGLIARQLRSGMSLNEALQEAAFSSGCPVATAKKYWLKSMRDKSKSAVKARNRLIMDMHLIGITNASIADRVDMHPVSVSRLINQIKKKEARKEFPVRA